MAEICAGGEGVMYECTNCHGCGCKFCGGIGYVIQDRPVVEMAPPTFEEFYSDEIKAAGFIKLADDEVVVKRATASYALSILTALHRQSTLGAIMNGENPADPVPEILELQAALNREVEK